MNPDNQETAALAASTVVSPTKSEAQHSAEAEVDSFRQDLGPFVVAAETTQMPMIFTNARESDNPIIFANDSFLRLTGYAREDLLGSACAFLSRRSDGAGLLASIAGCERASEEGIEHCLRRKDGSLFWAATFISPVRDKHGVIVQNFASFTDLTRHKDEQVHCRMLVDELNHRVKNTLSAVQSIAWQAFRKSDNPAVIREAIESRLFAIARLHDLLTRQDWTGSELHILVRETLQPFIVTEKRSARLSISGDNIPLSPKATLALGIALHELASNALKHGAFSNDTGSIDINWTIEPSADGDRLALHWQEKNGPEVVRSSSSGFGTQVIVRGLAHELGGSVSLVYPPAGASCTVSIPFPRGRQNG